uniref:Turripeptide OL47 n=1 Tax=Iotyrris olangoensis TaxID=2420066 RepID=TU47_IOTOL|nr:RecName: Full=Turripeptide OL47 [Iotyrris olangoensis]
TSCNAATGRSPGCFCNNDNNCRDTCCPRSDTEKKCTGGPDPCPPRQWPD